jgi:TetR/AcrR family transcriptional regulator, transcriptional repressor for nem operon
VATRARIVEAAADLMARRGVGATALDDVRAATSTSKSQLYHYFEDKADLVRAVIERQRDVVLAEQRLDEEPLDSLEALTRWRYRTLAAHRRAGQGRSCPLGRMAAELVDDERARATAHAALEMWRAQLATGLSTMVERGVLRPAADVDALATALLAAVQAGRLLAATAGNPEPLRRCLDAAIAQVTDLAADPRVRSSEVAWAGTTERAGLVPGRAERSRSGGK